MHVTHTDAVALAVAVLAAGLTVTALYAAAVAVRRVRARDLAVAVLAAVETGRVVRDTTGAMGQPRQWATHTDASHAFRMLPDRLCVRAEHILTEGYLYVVADSDRYGCSSVALTAAGTGLLSGERRATTRGRAAQRTKVVAAARRAERDAARPAEPGTDRDPITTPLAIPAQRTTVEASR